MILTVSVMSVTNVTNVTNVMRDGRNNRSPIMLGDGFLSVFLRPNLQRKMALVVELYVPDVNQTFFAF